jgi:ABC-type transport system involved in cytochrome c biogenesis permease subunit
MNSSEFFTITTFVYLGAGILFLIFLCSKERKFEKAGNYVVLAGLLIHTMGILIRWKEPYGLVRVQSPNTIPYEMMIIFPWMVVLNFMIFKFKRKFDETGPFVMPFAIMGMIWAQLSRHCDIIPSPGMDSNWPAYYVFTSSFAYAAFAMACSVSVMYLVGAKSKKNGTALTNIACFFPSAEVLTNLNTKKVKSGFYALTLSLVIGAFWSNFAWGAFWSWAPLEVWSLFIWFVFAALLYLRFTRKPDGVHASWQTIFCFSIIVLSYIVMLPLFRGLVCY